MVSRITFLEASGIIICFRYRAYNKTGRNQLPPWISHIIAPYTHKWNSGKAISSLYICNFDIIGGRWEAATENTSLHRPYNQKVIGLDPEVIWFLTPHLALSGMLGEALIEDFYRAEVLSASRFPRCGSAREVLPWALHSSLHRLSAEWRKSQQGLPVQFKGSLWERALPELQKKPLQQCGLWGQQGQSQKKQQNVPEDSFSDALQR